MAGRKTLVVLLGAIALLAAAQTFGLTTQSAQACLSIGNASYRVATNMLGADLTVRIDSTAAAPDLRIALTESADAADFIFVDDGNAPLPCGANARMVRIDVAAVKPDVLVDLASEPATADYRIYVRSRRVAPQAIAALFAAAHAPLRLAGRAE